MRRENPRHIISRQSLCVVLLLSLCLISSFIFTRNNYQRILEQNEVYTSDTARQTVDRIDELLQMYQASMDVLAITVEQMIQEPCVDTELLSLMQETSSFDYVEFVDATGQNRNASGITSYSGDRKNYLDGMQGHRGTDVIFQSRITHETLINFYSPVYYDGEIIGVLNGMCRERTVREVISVELFGQPTRTYLCMGDGTIISSTGIYDTSENILKETDASPKLTPGMAEPVLAAFRDHESCSFTYEDGEGISNASITALSTDDWVLLQVFPSSLTSRMAGNANAAGIQLEVRLLVIFGLYLFYLIWNYVRQRRDLVSEKERLAWIIEGIIPLFTRILIVDYDKGTYEYIDTPHGTASPLARSNRKGTLARLNAYMGARYINPDGTLRAGTLMDQKMIQSGLQEDQPYLQYEYRIRWGGKIHWETASIMSMERRDGIPVTVLFAIQDVTAMKDREHRLEKLAVTDGLTMFLNKTATRQAIDAALAQDPQAQFAFFMFDIDHFKEANDQFGHAFGDKVIIRFADTIRHCFRSSDLLGRIGGDEFAVLAKTPNPAWARERAKLLSESLDQDFVDGDNRWHMSASIGVAFAPDNGATYQELYQHADQILYIVKRGGRGSYSFTDHQEDTVEVI